MWPGFGLTEDFPRTNSPRKPTLIPSILVVSSAASLTRISFATPDSSPREFQRDSVFQLGAPEGRELVRGPDQGFNRNRVAAIDRLIRVSIPIDSAAEAEAAFV